METDEPLDRSSAPPREGLERRVGGPYPKYGYNGEAPAFLAAVAARRSRLRARIVSVFSVNESIDLEIGCGHGHFLTAYAKTTCEVPCVGIDIIGDRVERAERKRRRGGIDNLYFLKCEAGEFLDCLPSGLSLRRIFVLFPDPWPKRRHWKKRLLDRHFLARLGGRAGEGAELFFRTDHEDYFQWVAEEVRGAPDWRLCPDRPWPFEHPTVFQEKASDYRSLVLVRGR